MNFNKAIILGRLTAPLALKNTTSGQQVASGSVATNRTWTNKEGEKQEQVEFHNVIFWGKSAEIASTYLDKGSLVLVEGRIQTRTWTDKQGTERRTTEIIVENFQLGPAKEKQAIAPSTPKTAPLDPEDDEQEAEMKKLFGE